MAQNINTQTKDPSTTTKPIEHGDNNMLQTTDNIILTQDTESTSLTFNTDSSLNTDSQSSTNSEQNLNKTNNDKNKNKNCKMNEMAKQQIAGNDIFISIPNNKTKKKISRIEFTTLKSNVIKNIQTVNDVKVEVQGMKTNVNTNTKLLQELLNLMKNNNKNNNDVQHRKKPNDKDESNEDDDIKSNSIDDNTSFLTNNLSYTKNTELS